MIFSSAITTPFRGGKGCASGLITTAPQSIYTYHSFPRVSVLVPLPQGDALGYQALQAYGLHTMATSAH